MIVTYNASGTLKVEGRIASEEFDEDAKIAENQEKASVAFDETSTSITDIDNDTWGRLGISYDQSEALGNPIRAFAKLRGKTFKTVQIKDGKKVQTTATYPPAKDALPQGWVESIEEQYDRGFNRLTDDVGAANRINAFFGWLKSLAEKTEKRDAYVPQKKGPVKNRFTQKREKGARS